MRGCSNANGQLGTTAIQLQATEPVLLRIQEAEQEKEALKGIAAGGSHSFVWSR